MYQNFTKFYWYEICIELKCVRSHCIVQLEFLATTTTNETQRTESHFPNQDYADDILAQSVEIQRLQSHRMLPQLDENNINSLSDFLK